MRKKKKLSFKIAHSLAATGIVFAVACDNKPPNVNTPPPEQPEEPIVNTPPPAPEHVNVNVVESPPSAADAGSKSDASTEALRPPSVNTPPPAK